MEYIPKIGDKVVVTDDSNVHTGVYGGNYVDFVTHVDGGNMCKIDNKLGGWVPFDCVEPYKENQEMQNEISLQNVKFDMKAIAEELGVSLEKAHNIVQTALFERDVSWYGGKYVKYTHSDWLFVEKLMLTYDDADVNPEYKLMSIKPQYSFYVKEEEKPETIEFNGKQYNKEDVAKALALLSPVK